MTWFHLERFLFFQSTSQKTINHSVSTKLLIVGGVAGLTSRVPAQWSWGSSFSPGPAWRPQRARGAWGALVVSPWHGWAVPQHCCCHPTASVPGGVLDLRQALFGSRHWGFAISLYISGVVVVVPWRGPVTCCVILHPPLSVLLTPSCTSGASSGGAGVPKAAHTQGLFGMVQFPLCAQLMWRQMWTDASNTVCLYSVSKLAQCFLKLYDLGGLHLTRTLKGFLPLPFSLKLKCKMHNEDQIS